MDYLLQLSEALLQVPISPHRIDAGIESDHPLPHCRKSLY